MSFRRRAVLSTPQWTSSLMRTIPLSCMLTYRHSAAPEAPTHTESLLGQWCTPHWRATNAEPHYLSDDPRTPMFENLHCITSTWFMALFNQIHFSRWLKCFFFAVLEVELPTGLSNPQAAPGIITKGGHHWLHGVTIIENPRSFVYKFEHCNVRCNLHFEWGW
jgi:hypothetical protein